MIKAEQIRLPTQQSAVENSPNHTIPLSVPSLGGNTRRYIEECIATNFVSSVGPFVERFEREFSAYVGSKFAVACSSGTAAIHVALRLLDLQPDDEVFLATLTFAGSVNPILYERGRPVLVDSERETWNQSSPLIIAELERRARLGIKQPRAVEAVHLLGHPCELETLSAACDRFGVTLIEDAAEALGARYIRGKYAGRHVGTIGKIGCFSFNGNKIVTTGGGGIVTTDDEALARRAKHLTTQARLPGAEYFHDEVGYNYRLTNLCAALGVAQMELLPQFLERKRAIAKRYDRAFANLPGVTVPPRADWAESTHWYYTISLAPEFSLDRKQLWKRLDQERIQSRPIWTPLHLMPIYAKYPRLGGEVAESLYAGALSLPCSSDLSATDQDRVIAAITAALAATAG